MKVKNILFEDFTDYKKTCMLIGTCYCDWKCCIENNLPISTCQNCKLAQAPEIEVSADEIFRRYSQNPFTHALCFAGLEPLKQVEDVYNVIKYFRDNGCNDDIIIYTGYYEHEIQDFIDRLKANFKNIILKTGRFIPNQQPHYDEVLGVMLASDNQKGVKIC